MLNRIEMTERAADLRGWWMEWWPALRLGLGISIAFRVLITAWMMLVWELLGERMGLTIDSHNRLDMAADLPRLGSSLTDVSWGVWRRWDAVHYMQIALDGYQLRFPGESVFAPLTALCIRIIDRVLPGTIDLAALVYGVVVFGLVLALALRLAREYLPERGARKTITLIVISPLSYVLVASYSDGLFLLLALLFFYAAHKRRWWVVALAGFLASLTRLQGAALVGVALVILLFDDPEIRAQPWPRRLLEALRQGWMVLFIPLGGLAFYFWREAFGFPPLSVVYETVSNRTFSLPWFALWSNIQFIVRHPGPGLFRLDSLLTLIIPVLLILMVRQRPLRKAGLITYAAGYYIVFLCYLLYDAHYNVRYSESFARYALAFFPVTFMLANGLANLPGRLALSLEALSVALLLFYSGAVSLGFGAY
ncbi:MAG: hypothetical protein IT326_04615 [Anaerolineae bacterium]|nr:hypothetical protein [Anaerolineae bacterium]